MMFVRMVGQERAITAIFRSGMFVKIEGVHDEDP
jgi:hypothetical protein